MATPVNTTLTEQPFCVRQITPTNGNGTLEIFSRQTTSGTCPGTFSEGNHYRCCGIHDTCLGYGFCHHSGTYDGSSKGRSGFYMAGCNDANYVDDVACPKICVSEGRADVVWDDGKKLWRCCGTDSDGVAACDKPVSGQGIWFEAPEPTILLGDRSDETVNGVRLGTAVVTKVSFGDSPAGNTVYVPGHGSHLSSYAAAGIAVGVIVPVVLLSVVGFFFMKRRKAMKKRDANIEMTSMEHWHR